MRARCLKILAVPDCALAAQEICCHAVCSSANAMRSTGGGGKDMRGSAAIEEMRGIPVSSSSLSVSTSSSDASLCVKLATACSAKASARAFCDNDNRLRMNSG